MIFKNAECMDAITKHMKQSITKSEISHTGGIGHMRNTLTEDSWEIPQIGTIHCMKTEF